MSRSFAELLVEYMSLAGISVDKLATKLGVERSTILRWRTGRTKRPRYRDDVLRCAKALQLTPEETDRLLVSVGYRQEHGDLPAGEEKRELLDERVEAVRGNYLRNVVEILKPKEKGILDLGEYVELPLEFAESADNRAKRKQIDHINDVIGVHNALIILGEPGSGKSTLLRQAALDFAQSGLINEAAPIPILIELWKWAANEPSFTSFFIRLIDTEDEYELLRLLDSPSSLLSKKNIVLLLDGLDELRDEKVRILKDWLLKTDLRVLLSCREADFIAIRKMELPVVFIEPLEDAHVLAFSEKFLGQEEAGFFVSYFLDDRPGDRLIEEHHISKLARTPFSLMLMLAQFKEKPWDDAPNRWSLLSFIVNRLWKEDRVQNLLTIYGLPVYSEAEAIIPLLSRLASLYLEYVSIDRKDVQALIPEGLDKVLVEAGLIEISAFRVRFRHPLFAEFFAAHKLYFADDLRPFAIKGDRWAGSLTILAGYSEQKRQEVQRVLLEVIVEGKAFYEYSRGSLWALGEIGDKDTIGPLIESFEVSSEKEYSTLLKAIGCIANRLPDDSLEKQLVIQKITKVLLSETIAGVSDFLEKGMYPLLEVWGAAEALAEIRNKQAAEALMQGLKKLAGECSRVGDPFPMVWQVFHGIARGFARIGKAAVPVLLEGIESEDFRVGEVSSQALSLMRWSVPVEPLIHALAMHPSSIVRFQTAVKMAALKNPGTIPHLVAALNDNGVWQRGRSHFLFDIPVRYYYVADAAAYALAQFGMNECQSILKERLYDSRGIPTAELLVYRIEDSESEYEWRIQWARYLAGMPGGLAVLLSRMGHLEIDARAVDPMAMALIQRHRTINDVPISSLQDYLVMSDDTRSRTWVTYVLGQIGDLAIIDFLRQFTVPDFDPALRSVAAGAIGVILSGNLSYPQLAEEVENLLSMLGSVAPGLYGGIGLGLSRIVQNCREQKPEMIQLIVRRLFDCAKGENVETALGALDALDSLYFVLSFTYDFDSQIGRFRYIDISTCMDSSLADEFLELVRNNPSMHMKSGNFLLDDDSRDRRNSLEKVIDHYQQAIELKTNKKVAWFSRLTESDWKALGCDDGNIYFGMGKAYYGLGQWEDAFEAYQQAIELFDVAPHSQEESGRKRLICLIKAGYCAFTHDPEQAFRFFIEAVELTEKIEEPTSQLKALMGAQACTIELEDWSYAIQIGEKAVEVAQSVFGKFTQQCEILLNTALANEKLGNTQKAIQLLDEAVENARHYGLRRYWTQALVVRAGLWNLLGDAMQAEQDISKAKAVYREIQDWPKLADALAFSAEFVYGQNLEQKLSLYQEASKCLDRVQGEEFDEQKAGLVVELGKIYDELNRYSEAEDCYWQAIEILKDNEMSPLEASILVDFGRHLHRVGQTDRGTELALRALVILQVLEEDTSIAEAALMEMSTQPEWRIPSAIVPLILENALDVLTSKTDRKAPFFQELLPMMVHARANGWKAEEEFLSAISDIVNGQSSCLSDTNPYHETFNEFSQKVVLLSAFPNIEDEVLRSLVRLINAQGWQVVKEILVSCPELLCPEIEKELNRYIQDIQSTSASRFLDRLIRTRVLLRFTREKGIEEASRILNEPIDLLVLREIAVAEDRDAVRRVINEHPELLSPDLDDQIELLIRTGQAEGSSDQLGFMVFVRELLRLCREIGVDEVFDNLPKSSEINAIITEFISTPDWDAAHRFLEAHEELLSPKVDTEFEILTRMAQVANNQEMVTVLGLHHTLLQLCRDFGIDDGYKLFIDFGNYAEVAIQLAQVQDLDDKFRILDAHPEMVTAGSDPEADEVLKFLMAQGELEWVQNFLAWRGLLALYRERKAEEAFLEHSLQPGKAKLVLELIGADDWQATGKVLERYPELLSPDVDAEFERGIELARANHATVLENNLEIHLALIRRCREAGVEPAVREAALLSRLRMLARNTIAALTIAGEQKEEWLGEVQSLLEETEEPQMEILLKSLVVLLEDDVEDLDSLSEGLEGPYANCLFYIIEEMSPVSDEDILNYIAETTVNVLTDHPEKQHEWLQEVEGYLTDSGDQDEPEMTGLLASIERLLKGADPAMLSSELDGLYASCWEQILEGIRGR